jgi:hypothetical protein
MDKITQRLFAGLFGTAAIIFAFAFLIRSASPAQADNGPQTTYSTGKYMMTFQAVVAQGSMNYYILIWNTETGYSKMYYGDDDVSFSPANSNYQLPSSPL